MAGIVIVPDWVAELAESYADEISAGCPVAVAIERAVVDALARPPAVLALPPEPPVGTVVEVAAGQHAGTRWRHDLRDYYGWRNTEAIEVCPWQTLLFMAGPAGVRVVGGG